MWHKFIRLLLSLVPDSPSTQDLELHPSKSSFFFLQSNSFRTVVLGPLQSRRASREPAWRLWGVKKSGQLDNSLLPFPLQQFCFSPCQMLEFQRTFEYSDKEPTKLAEVWQMRYGLRGMTSSHAFTGVTGTVIPKISQLLPAGSDVLVSLPARLIRLAITSP